MKIAVLFASNRHGGKHEEIKQMLLSLSLPHEYDFIEMADCEITHCKQDCPGCVIKSEGRCLFGDDFEKIQTRLVSADMNLIVVPAYCPYPSKFTALMEKLLNSCYLTENKPLKNKPTSIFYYCSSKIVDDTGLKILWQKYLMDEGYSFSEPNYPFLNQRFDEELNERFDRDITKYIREFMLTAGNPNFIQ